MPSVNLFYRVKVDIRAWESPKAVHKRGWLNAGEQIHVIEEYGGALRFDPAGHPDILVEANYTEAWVIASDVSNLEKLTGPAPFPPTQTVTALDAGKALGTLISFIKQMLK